MEQEFETITLNIEEEAYNKLLSIAKENKTTIDNIINKYLELCVKEKGFIIWENGFNKPYTIIRDKETIQKMLEEDNGLKILK